MNAKITNRQILLLIVILAFFCMFLRLLGFADRHQNFIGFFVIAYTVPIVIWKIKSISSNKLCYILFTISFLIHIAFLFTDVFYKPVFMNGGDSQCFYDCAIEYYHKDFTRDFTNYPYFLFLLMIFFGPSRIVLQYVNIFLWFINVVLMNEILSMLNVSNKLKNLCMFVFLFSPIHICFMSILLRDCLVSTCMIASFYFLIKWIKFGNIRYILYSILITIPGLIMHVGTMVATCSVVLVCSLYSKQKKKLMFQKKTLIILGIALFSLLLCFANPFTRVKIFSHVPSFENFNMIDYCNNSIAQRPVGGSQYLVGYDPSNYLELLVFSVIRFLYFYLSPVLSNCRDVKDYLAFAADSLIYLLSLVLLIVSAIKRNWDIIKTSVSLYVFGFGLFFEWAVTNAGTAMRHRGKIFGIVIIAIVYCLKELKLSIKNENNV